MSDRDFAKYSVLEILVPEATDLDIEEALSSAETSSEDTSILSSIPQRNLLYFDEDLPLFAILRTPYQDEGSLKDHISRLTVDFEAHATSSPGNVSAIAGSPPSHVQGPLRDIIWTSKLDVSEDPIIVVVGSDEEEDGQDALLIWKLNAFLSRPRVRLTGPAVNFKVSASLQPPARQQTKASNRYLPSGVPFAANVLEPLGNSSGTDGPALHLAASRLSRAAAPSTRQERSELLPLRVSSKKAFRAIPAISSRIRYHRAHGAVGKSAIVASLELDIPIFAQYPIELKSVSIQYSNGDAQEMMNKSFLELPMTCHARDSIVCLYSLSPNGGAAPASGTSPGLRSLDVMIDALVLSSETCVPKIQIRWRQNVDFATALNPNYGRAGRFMQRNNRPANLSSVTTGNNTSILGDGSKSFSNGELGVTATFSSEYRVYVGKPFKWGVFMVNRSSKPRQFALSMLSKRRMGDKGRSSRSGSTSSVPGSESGLLAEAVMDDNVLFATIKSQAAVPTQLISLNPEVKTSVLDPGSCYTTELEFLPLAEGYLHTEAIRITDTDSGTSIDVRDLPDVVARREPTTGN